MEEFKKIDNYEDYQVSNLGKVFSIKKNRLLKQSTHSKGYLVVSLKHKETGHRTLIRVHRLVANAFIPNPQNKSSIDHIDGNRKNNKIENLRWAFTHENSHNRKIPSNNKSGYKGVFYNKKRKKFVAYIMCNGLMNRLGTYGTVEEARMIRQTVANRLFGEFTNECEKMINETQAKLNYLLNDAIKEINYIENKLKEDEPIINVVLKY